MTGWLRWLKEHWLAVALCRRVRDELAKVDPGCVSVSSSSWRSWRQRSSSLYGFTCFECVARRSGLLREVELQLSEARK